MRPPHDEHVFLVRMWRENEPAAAGAWRGSVHEVATGRRLYVTAPAEVSDFIAVALAREPAADRPDRGT